MIKLKQNILNIWFAIYERVKHFYIKRKYALSIMTSDKTLEYIKNHKCSIARYGDGEFDLMMGKGEEVYQHGTDELASALKKVFQNDSGNLLICLPYPMVNTSQMKKGQFWRYWAIHKQKDVVQFIQSTVGRKKYQFGDSFISRPFSGFKTASNAEKIFPRLKELWDGRDVLFVEGADTRLGIGNDLFDNCKSIKRILAPSVNAFDLYPKILNAVLDKWNGELVIIALGPTATILASDLSKRGIQALDIGHVDIQYEWFLKGEAFVPVESKFTNESLDHEVGKKCEDVTYHSQIIMCVNPKTICCEE